LCFLPRWRRLPSAAAQDAAAVWNAVTQASFDPAKSGHVENIVITRDRMRITLISGEIQFGRPANGVVFAAAFSGRGKLEIQPPNPLEAQQLQLMARTKFLSVEFTEATFSFTDTFLQDVSGSMKWSPSPAGQLADLYGKRQTEREDVGAEIVPRVFLGVLSGYRAHRLFCGRIQNPAIRLGVGEVRCAGSRASVRRPLGRGAPKSGISTPGCISRPAIRTGDPFNDPHWPRICSRRGPTISKRR
jgi:hypothetical protein